MYDEKGILHYKRCYMYINKRILLIKGGYYLEFSGSGGKKVDWEVVDAYIVEDLKYNYEVGLWRVGYNFFEEDMGEGGGKRSIK